MWIQRGHKRKLKKNAIPTIFGIFLKKQVPTNKMEIDNSTIDNNKINHVDKSLEHAISDIEMKQNKVKTVSLLFLLEKKNKSTVKEKYIIVYCIQSVQIMINDTTEFATDDITLHKEDNMETGCLLCKCKTREGDKKKTDRYEKILKKQRLHLTTVNKKVKALQSIITI